MAAAGAVTIKATLDASGVERGVKGVKSALEGIDDVANASASGLGKASSEADKTSRAFVGLGKDGGSGKKGLDGVRDAGRNIVSGTLGLATITGTAFGIADLASEAISAQDALTKFESTMGFAGFDDAHIKQAKEAVKAYADDTVYDMETIANTTAQLAANGVKDYTGLTQAAGNLNAVAGGNSETFKSVAMTLTQTAGAGKLTTENWNQLADAIPGASGKLQEAMLQNGAYTGNFREAMEKGEITADEFNQAIMQLGNEPVAVEAAKSTSTFEGAIGQLQATAVNAFLQIYNSIGQDNITGAINAVTSAVQRLIDNFDWIAPIVTGLVGTFAALKAAMAIQGAITSAVTAIKGLSAGVGLAKGAFTALNAVMRANPLGIIVTVIGLLITAFMTLWNTNEGFRNAVMGIWDAIVGFISGAVGAIVGFFTEGIPSAFNGLVSFFTQLPGQIGTFLMTVLLTVGEWVVNLGLAAFNAGSQFLMNIVNFFTQLPGNIATFLLMVITNVALWVGQMIQNAISMGTQFLANVIAFFTQLPGNVLNFLLMVISNVVNWVSQMVQNAVSMGTQFLSNVGSFFSQLPGKIWEFLASAISKASEFVGQMASKALEAGQQFLNNIVNTLSGIPGAVYSIGCDIVRGIIGGIQSTIGGVGDALWGGISGAINGVKNLLGIHSPSTLMRDLIGKNMAAGVSVGFEADDPMAAIMKDVEGFAGEAAKIDWYSTAGGYSKASLAPDGFADGLANDRSGNAASGGVSGGDTYTTDKYTFSGDIYIKADDVEQVRDMGELARAIMKQGGYSG